MTILDFIIWSPSPDIIVIPGLNHPIRWYGLLFALGFILGQQVMLYVFKKEGKDIKHVDQLTMYMVIAVIVGARLGHCLFYDPVHYLSNPLKILAVWEGGLASHGGGIGVFIAVYLFARKYNYKYLWVLDRLAIITALTGVLIRTGNFMNSEIIGLPTESDYGVVFARSFEEMVLKSDERIEKVDFRKEEKKSADTPGKVPLTATITYKKKKNPTAQQQKLFFENTIPRILRNYPHIRKHFFQESNKVPYKSYQSKGRQLVDLSVIGISRHPGQLYEAIACFVIMLVIGHLWYHNRSQLKDGFMFGLFMVMLWTERFFVEFFKENQEAWEADIPLNMGQWLSIPMFIFGALVLIKSLGKRESISG